MIVDDTDTSARGRAVALAEADSKFRRDFPRWLHENWGIWQRFEAEANKTWEFLAGKVDKPHYAARTIIEYIRHHTMLTELTGPFKVNGNYVPDLSRLYRTYYPDREGFFEERNQQKANRPSDGVRGATNEMDDDRPVAASRTNEESTAESAVQTAEAPPVAAEPPVAAPSHDAGPVPRREHVMPATPVIQRLLDRSDSARTSAVSIEAGIVDGIESEGDESAAEDDPVAAFLSFAAGAPRF